MWIIYIVFNKFVTWLLPFFFFNALVFWLQSMWDLTSPTRHRTHTLCIERRVLNTGPPGIPWYLPLAYLFLRHLILSVLLRGDCTWYPVSDLCWALCSYAWSLGTGFWKLSQLIQGWSLKPENGKPFSAWIGWPTEREIK